MLDDKRIVCLFPGQGSQHVGMGADLYRHYPQARRRFDQADKLLGYKLSRLCFKGPVDVLNSDLNAQLAVYTVSCILADLLKQAHMVPEAVTGYSSGYYAAAYAAGGLSFEQGLAIVKLAGEILLDEGRHIDGKMAVIFGLPHNDVAAICTHTGDVDMAIVNTAQQVIVSGLAPAVQRVITRCLAAGALDAYCLPAETAYHSRFMEPARKRLADAIPRAHVSDPQIPIMSYATLEMATVKKDLAQTITAQLTRTVRWCDLLRELGAKGDRQFLETGPGAVISRAARWVDRRMAVTAIGSAEALGRVVGNRLQRESSCPKQSTAI